MMPVEQARLAHHIERAAREQIGELLARLAEQRRQALLGAESRLTGTTAQSRRRASRILLLRSSAHGC